MKRRNFITFTALFCSASTRIAHATLASPARCCQKPTLTKNGCEFDNYNANVQQALARVSNENNVNTLIGILAKNYPAGIVTSPNSRALLSDVFGANFSLSNEQSAQQLYELYRNEREQDLLNVNVRIVHGFVFSTSEVAAARLFSQSHKAVNS